MLPFSQVYRPQRRGLALSKYCNGRRILHLVLHQDNSQRKSMDMVVSTL